MMTDRLHYDDAYLCEFDAFVICVREGGWVALDRSAFYPTSGGQPFDTGTLESGSTTAHVLDVMVEKDVVWHLLDTPLNEGKRVHGRIDWTRRFEHMQQHAADHMLAGAAFELFGGVTIGLHLGKDASSIDMELPGGRTRLTPAECDTLEALVNARIQKDDMIRCWFPSPRELNALPLRKRPTVQEHVRVVAMGDYEMVACGGTHPSTTGQIGPVKILSCLPARGKMRLTFVAGMRAVRYLQRAVSCAQGLSVLLSADVDTAADALVREREAAADSRHALEMRLRDAVQAAIRAAGQPFHGGRLYVLHVPFADRAALLHASAEIVRTESAVCLLSCPEKGANALLFLRSEDRNEDMSALLRAAGARGGGKPDMAQGSTSADVLETASALLKQA